MTTKLIPRQNTRRSMKRTDGGKVSRRQHGFP